MYVNRLVMENANVLEIAKCDLIQERIRRILGEVSRSDLPGASCIESLHEDETHEELLDHFRFAPC